MLICFKDKNIKPILNKPKPPKVIQKFDRLWFIATNLREPINLYDFLRTAKEMENLTWTHNTQIDFHLKLIQNRAYLRPDFSQSFNGLSDAQKELLCNTDIDITYEQAKEIANAKCYNDKALRGRSDMSPLTKLGLVMPFKYSKRKIIITDVGNRYLNHEISLEDMLIEQFLKMQYPCALDPHNIEWNTKPFINTLNLIKQVNKICLQKGMKAKGITKTETGIFVISLKCPSDIETVANKLIDFRINYSKLKTKSQKSEYLKNYVENYLKNIYNPLDKIEDYADSIIRYMRATKYIYIRGKYGNACIDLEPRRMVEINSILEHDKGTCDVRENWKWIEYYTTYGTYNIPFNTVEKQQEILHVILNEINTLEEKLHKKQTIVPLISDLQELKNKIAELRDYRTKLQNLEIHCDSEHDVSKIDEVITSLQRLSKSKKSDNLEGLKPSVALEKWVNVALNIISDSILIKPNSIVGDDNEPISTAPAGVPDIECYYDNFNVVCEVTMLTDRSQWYYESQPVFRHINNFVKNNSDKTCYGLVIAPTWHEDSINEYHIHVKHGYVESEMKIIPLKIVQLIDILKTVKFLKEAKMNINQEHIKHLYDNIIQAAMENNSEEWVKIKIPEILDKWQQSMLELINRKEKPLEKLWNKLGLYRYRPFQDVEYYIDFTIEKQYTILEYLSQFYSIKTYPVEFYDGTHHAISIDMPEHVEAIHRRFDVALADLLYMIYDGLKPQEQAVINGILKKPTLKDDISKYAIKS